MGILSGTSIVKQHGTAWDLLSGKKPGLCCGGSLWEFEEVDDYNTGPLLTSTIFLGIVDDR